MINDLDPLAILRSSRRAAEEMSASGSQPENFAAEEVGGWGGEEPHVVVAENGELKSHMECTFVPSSMRREVG